ncbi:MAG TPA: hypothetical protein VKI61_08510 [Chitinophagaceae bacterium]|jgi:hypothetical protein|nr:hypothetical protein [Chitinophagaceae bacterium]
MKNFLVLFLFCLLAITSFAQVPEDALKFSWFPPNGTARTQAIGGAIGALGADVSSNFVNPAGIAFFKTNDFVVSPGFSVLKNNSSFRGDSKSDQKSFFNLGTSGAVFGFNNPNSTWNGSAFSIAVSTIANFNNRISYSGKNNFSSYGEQYAAEAAASGISLDNILGSSLSIGTQLAYYTYLLDTLSVPGASGNPQFVSLAQWSNLKNGKAFLVNQQNSIETSGGITEIALSFAATHTDKFYLGGSLGIPIVSYTKNSVFTETDATGDADNNFEHSTLTERYTTKGVGFNLKLGAIYKPVDQLRVGLAVHSPTVYGLKDTYYANMTTNTENYVHTGNSTISASSDQTLNYSPQYKYDLNSPWKFIVSGAYVIHEVEDVKQQRGFISADIEYLTYRSNSYKTAEQDNSDNSYYDGVNQGIKAYYKNALNFRVGGELKFNTIMGRLGFSYYTDPYKDSELKGKKMFLSGGLGYRNKGLFIDLTYVHSIINDVNFPYRLSDKANTFATIKGAGENVIVTAGIKF